VISVVTTSVIINVTTKVIAIFAPIEHPSSGSVTLVPTIIKRYEVLISYSYVGKLYDALEGEINAMFKILNEVTKHILRA